VREGQVHARDAVADAKYSILLSLTKEQLDAEIEQAAERKVRPRTRDLER
jgi:hypothetical protein